MSHVYSYSSLSEQGITNNQLIHADNTSLSVWRQDDLTSAIEALSQATQSADHHRLANLAIVRTRLKQWELAEQDARMSLQVQPTILGHIAVSIALAGQGKRASAKLEFNQAFLRKGPKNDCLLLLIKSIIVLIAGEPNEAMRRVADVVNACEAADQPLCRAVQARMQYHIGKTALDGKDYKSALELFSSAQALAPFSKLPELDTISLIFGWHFDSLPLGIRQWTCEALYAMSRMAESAQSLRSLLNEFGTEIKANEELSDWYQDITRRCIVALEAAGDAAVANGQHEEAIEHYSATLSLDPPSRANVLVKRNKARLAIGAWDGAMKDLSESGPIRFTLYTQVGEALLGAGRVKEATNMLRSFGGDAEEDLSTGDSHVHEERAAWELGFRGRCIEMLEKQGDAAMDSKNYEVAIGCYSDAQSLNPANLEDILVKRSKALIDMGLWQGALADANKEIELDSSSFRAYSVVCDTLERAGRLAEAIEYFRRMKELPGDSDPQDEQTRWELDFRRRCVEKLEKLGDTARELQKRVEAVGYYFNALSLDPANSNDIILKRSQEVIELDPSVRVERAYVR